MATDIVTSGSYLSESILRHASGWIIGLVLAFVPLWTTLARHPAGLFTYHPALQSVAVIAFIQGVVLLQPQPKNIAAKQKGLQLHQVFQLLALPLIVAGSAVIVYNKVVNNGKHLYSWHGWFGAATLFLIVLQITFGAIVVYTPLTRLVGGVGRAKSLWKYHRLSGYVTLALLLITPLLALDSDWIKNNTSESERLVMGIGLGLVAVGVLTRVQVSKLGFR
ncbi:hypothetical protein OIV83_003966 [Microbotryomycetes sp. JL201]|nr:hypothetical protein OIV83_003966 [Microbotryomycetes sp. JL201]